MPRKYTRRQPVDDSSAEPVAASPVPVTGPMFSPQLSALDEYGQWLKANRHITDPLPALPPAPRKTKK